MGFSEDGLAVAQDRRQNRWCGHGNTDALGGDKLRSSSNFSGKSEIKRTSAGRKEDGRTEEREGVQ